MLAEAMIVQTVIVLGAYGDYMRPFYRASQYGMKNSVGYMIRRTSNMVMPQMEALFDDVGLTFSQWTVLMALREWRQSTSGEIARNICHDAGSLTRMLDQLEKRGLIQRLRSDADRRVVSLTLTPKGLVLVETLMPRVVDFWNALLGDFSHVEIKLLIKFLSRLTMAAEGGREIRGRGRQPDPHPDNHHDERRGVARRARGRRQ